MAEENWTPYNGTNTLDLLSERGRSQINKLPVGKRQRWARTVGLISTILMGSLYLLTEPSSPGEAESAEVSLPESGVAGEPHMEDQTNRGWS